MDKRQTVGMFGQKVPMGQAKGPDVDLIVNGKFESSGVSVALPPPAGIEQHAAESETVRQQKIKDRLQQMDRNAHPGPREEQ